MALLRRASAVAAGAAAAGALALAPLHAAPPERAAVVLAIPGAAAARAGAALARIPMPAAARGALLRAYARADARMEGAEGFGAYRSLDEFWGRRRVGAGGGRGGGSGVWAPCDGDVVAAGLVGDRGGVWNSGAIPVPAGAGAGVEWNVRGLLGAGDRDRLSVGSEAGAFELTAVVLRVRPRRDSHRLSAPADWTLRARRELRGGGDWLEGGEGYAGNRRAAWVGDWAHGMFALTAVGGVGGGDVLTVDDGEAWGGKAGTPMEAGREIGRLGVGSAIVLVFEAPTGAFKLDVAVGDVVGVGDSLGCVRMENAKATQTGVAVAPAADVSPMEKQAAAPASGRRLRRSW